MDLEKPSRTTSGVCRGSPAGSATCVRRLKVLGFSRRGRVRENGKPFSPSSSLDTAATIDFKMGDAGRSPTHRTCVPPDVSPARLLCRSRARTRWAQNKRRAEIKKQEKTICARKYPLPHSTYFNQQQAIHRINKNIQKCRLTVKGSL